ncbi:MAG TPA: glycosyltransferase family 2 protein [Leptolyngbya sp.]|nr:glycosyltransferase family 2 protein [Leptolyngbya sp.]
MEVTPLILTYNEAANIGRSLQRLTWAKQIVVIDSGSTDATLEILNAYPQVEVFTRSFDTHAQQWNYGLDKIDSEWVLSLDADYVLSPDVIQEIRSLPEQTEIDGFYIRFKYCVFGKPLHGTLLPPRQALFRREKATYIDDGHTQLLKVRGRSGFLNAPIYHDDRKPLSRWMWAQERYMKLEVQKLRSTPTSELSLSDRIRKTKILAPFVVLIYCLFLKAAILDGWAGWYYTLQRVLAEILLSIHLIQADQGSQNG